MSLSKPASGVWHPMDPAAAARILCAVDVPWWIAGGWALDLFVGTQTRAHKDLVWCPINNERTRGMGVDHRIDFAAEGFAGAAQS